MGQSLCRGDGDGVDMDRCTRQAGQWVIVHRETATADGQVSVGLVGEVERARTTQEHLFVIRPK